MNSKLPLLMLTSSALLASSLAWGDGQPRYKIVDLGSPPGGTIAQGSSLNDRGWIAGFAYTAGNAAAQAELWRRDQPPLDLGTLGGPNSGVAWPNRNDNGVVAGIAETAELQPLGEVWSCAEAVFNNNAPSGHVCRGFRWQDGQMTGLPTLGGGNGFATGVNEQGVIVGWAETTLNDPSCILPQVQQFLPVAWTPDNRPHALPTLAGDPDGAATAINQQGQIVGITGKCDNAVGRFSAIHAVMWDDGRVIDMGNIGGNAWNTPMDVNDRGEAVGFADLSGDPTGNNPTFHAFFWARGQAMVDLGTLPGDAISEALGINNRGEIVGLSFGAGFSHPQAVIWIHGQIFNLNSMVSNGSTMNLIDAQEINDRGEITGQGVDSSGNTPAFLLVPDDDD